MKTKLFERIRKDVRQLRPRAIFIDTGADVFAGNEIERGQVRQFIGGFLRKLAIDADAAVILITHPSLAGINSGTGLSGSTSWHNSVRARMYLKNIKDGAKSNNNLRELEFLKNNYGPLATTITLRYQSGLYVLVNEPVGLAKYASDNQANELFLTILKKLTKQNQRFSPHTGSTYAPKRFAEHADANGTDNKTFAAAMQRLLDANKITIEVYGPPSHQRRFLKINEAEIPSTEGEGART